MFVQVTTGVMGVWALDEEDTVYRWVLGDSNDGHWFEDPLNVPLRYIDSGYDSVWGVNGEDAIFKYTIAV